MRATRARFWIVAGVLGGLLMGEVALRVLEPSIPAPSPWPSVETQVKSAQLATLSQDVEVLLLGSSVTEAAVDPELLTKLTSGGVSYNSAMPFSTPLSNELWLDKVVLEHFSPSIVVFGIPVWPPHSTTETDVLRPGIEEATSLSTTSVIRGFLALTRNKGVLADWDERWVGFGLRSSDLWTDLGHLSGFYDVPPELRMGHSLAFGQPSMSDDNIEALQRTAGTLEQAGIQMVMMIEPGHFPGDVSDSVLAIYLESIRDLGRDLKVPVWDTYSVGWNPEYFVDGAHFNREGTVSFTSYLADLINEMVER